jgi:hypothetical protein
VPVLYACHAPAELHAAAASPVQRSEGALQRFSEQLLQQVPFQVLQAQVWHRVWCQQLATKQCRVRQGLLQVDAVTAELYSPQLCRHSSLLACLPSC